MVANWAHLGRVVKETRESLGLSQVKVYKDGDGPSDSTLTKIEAGVWQSRTPEPTLRKIDIGLDWQSGTARRVLYDGYDPTVGTSGQDAEYVASPGVRVDAGDTDSEVLREVRAMRAEMDALQERMANLEERRA